MRKFIIGISCLFILAGCVEDNSGASRETRQTMQLSEQAAIVVGMPAIRNFSEKRLLKTIYELRDNSNLVTYTYTIDLNGKRHKVCPSTSIGFGFPYATQYTAPKAPRLVKPQYPSGEQTPDWHSFDADQAEPNGLYMPSSSRGTWVVCLNPETKQMSPTYVEPDVVSYLFEMPSID